MPLVTSENREEFIEKELSRKAGKEVESKKEEKSEEEEKFPSYKVGEIIRLMNSGQKAKIHTIDKKNKHYIGHAVDYDHEKDEVKVNKDRDVAIPHGKGHSQRW